MDAYREKRGRWQQAIVRYLDLDLSGPCGGRSWRRRSTARCRSGNISTRPTARLWLRADAAARSGASRGRSPRTVVPGLYLASAYAGFGGYSGVVQSAGACADMILREPDARHQLVLRRKRSVFVPMNETKSPCRFQVAASLSAAISSSSACARPAGRRGPPSVRRQRSRYCPPPKTGPCRPCTRVEHRLAIVADLERRHPLGSRLTRGIQRHLHPERKPVFGAGRMRRRKAGAANTSATAAGFTKPVV